MAVLAEDAKLYYSPTDDWSGSDWTEICNVMDVSLSMSVSEVEVTRRCSGGYRFRYFVMSGLVRGEYLSVKW